MTMNFAKSGYASFRAQPAILIEVFLPKRNRFQGQLYDTLKDGFDREKVVAHFKNENPEVNRFLQWYTKTPESIKLEQLDWYESVLKGYSIFEVDGVFVGENSIPCNDCPITEKKNEEYKTGNLEFEERTQIVKIIFMPDYEKIIKKLKSVDTGDNKISRTRIVEITRTLFVNYPEKNVYFLNENNVKDYSIENVNEKLVDAFFPELELDKLNKQLAKQEITQSIFNVKIIERNLVEYLLKWIGFTAWFLFGFFVYKVCEEIDNQKEKYKPEQEIWVTSHWNFLVNKVLHKNIVENNEKRNQDDEENNPNNSISYLNYLLQQAIK